MTAELEMEESANRLFVIRKKISALIEVEVEAGGKWLHTYEKFRITKYNIENSYIEESSSEEESGSIDIKIEDDINFLRSLSPTDWKQQDHYLVLGLSAYRYRARDEDIRKAYRTMVLRHHPDKRKAAGEELREGDDYFTCITKAYEVLGVPASRRAYDSIDPDFDDEVPAVIGKSKSKFYENFGAAFERNARWSVRKHPPLLGKKDDSREKVERFYNFWYDFDTWREFSYLDEEEKENAADRDERRWMEKQNKAQRSKRKREEIARIRKLVNNAYNSDPRVIKFQEQDKEKKLALKKAKQDLIRNKQEEIHKMRREEAEKERKLKEEEVNRIKQKQDAEKKEKESAKKLLRKERKNLRNVCVDNDYFSSNDAERIQGMTDLELLCKALESVRLLEFNKELAEANVAGKKIVYMKQVAEIKEQIEREKMGSAYQPKSDTPNHSSSSRAKSWSRDDLQMLIKAVNLFPAGTTKRWEVVAEYMNQHGTKDCTRTAKDVIVKAKELQSSDGNLREATNKHAFQELIKTQGGKASVISDSEASQRLDGPQDTPDASKWAPDEQKLLEQAMKTYPSNTTNRWDKIAECLPNKNKKECMVRYKDLVDRVKAKKAAQTAVGKAK